MKTARGDVADCNRCEFCE